MALNVTENRAWAGIEVPLAGRRQGKARDMPPDRRPEASPGVAAYAVVR
jgi:hypothetical protein